jgi:hypothetical protein
MWSSNGLRRSTSAQLGTIELTPADPNGTRSGEFAYESGGDDAAG